jgi:hypothetical protein
MGKGTICVPDIKTQRFELNNYLFLYFAHVPIFRRQESRLGIPSPCPDHEPKWELGAGKAFIASL